MSDWKQKAWLLERELNAARASAIGWKYACQLATEENDRLKAEFGEAKAKSDESYRLFRYWKKSSLRAEEKLRNLLWGPR